MPWRPSPSTALVVAVALALVGNLATNTVQITWVWWPVAAWVVVGLLLVTGILIERSGAHLTAGGSSHNAGTELDNVAALLTEAVDRQWKQEAAARGLSQPAPLRLQWSSTSRPVAAGRDVVFDEPNTSSWEEAPLAGDLDSIVTEFVALPHRQLVVLGEPGAGKTVLAIMLTLGLTKARVRGQSAPVLLTLTEWEADREPLDLYLARRLAEEYPDLGAPAVDGGTLATVIVDHGEILPVLDGLDELPLESHVTALDQLDRWAAAGHPLVVTCRGAEYQRLVSETGLILSRAAVIEIEPVDVEKAIAFLRHPATARARWQRVFEHLRAEPHGPLATVLSTPLMVALARVSYQPPSTDPTELLEPTEPSAVATLLIGNFVRVLYRRDPAMRRSYDPAHASRWLMFLAYQMHRTHSREFHWWQLRSDLLSVPRPTRLPLLCRLVDQLDYRLYRSGRQTLSSRQWIRAGCELLRIRAQRPSLPPAPLAVAVAAMFGGLVSKTLLGWPDVIRISASTGAIVALGVSGLFRPLWPRGYPPYVPSMFRTPRQRWRLLVSVRLLFAIAVGLLAGTVVGTPVIGGLSGVGVGVVGCLVSTVGRPFGRLRRPDTSRGPRLNLQFAGMAALGWGLLGGVTYALACSVLGRAAQPATSGIVGAGYAVAVALRAGAWEWVRYRLRHAWLAASGHLPWRLATFLDDAARRGALRRAGTALQFRHALVQDHLARTMRYQHLARWAAGGDGYAIDELVKELARDGRLDELRAWADTGHEGAHNRLLTVLVEQGLLAELAERRDAGDTEAAIRLAGLAVDQGRIDDAIDALTIAASDGGWGARQQLIELLTNHGRIDALRNLTAAGKDNVAKRQAAEPLARLLARQGREEEAIEILLGIKYLDLDLAELLAELLVKHGRVEEVRARAEQGDHEAAWVLTKLLAERGDEEQAIQLFRQHGDAVFFDDRMTALLVRLGRVEQAAAYLRSRSRSPAFALTNQLCAVGREEEAKEYLRAAADAGDNYAAWRLGDLLYHSGELDELRTRADAGSVDAARFLAFLLNKQGRFDEAIVILRANVEAGDGDSRMALARLFAERGDLDAATGVLRDRVDSGDQAAAALLAELRSKHPTTR
jgi:thioredoxin-like negative regulator of GroEL